jgi:hypothetical protein
MSRHRGHVASVGRPPAVFFINFVSNLPQLGKSFSQECSVQIGELMLLIGAEIIAPMIFLGRG